MVQKLRAKALLRVQRHRRAAHKKYLYRKDLHRQIHRRQIKKSFALCSCIAAAPQKEKEMVS